MLGYNLKRSGEWNPTITSNGLFSHLSMIYRRIFDPMSIMSNTSISVGHYSISMCHTCLSFSLVRAPILPLKFYNGKEQHKERIKLQDIERW